MSARRVLVAWLAAAFLVAGCSRQAPPNPNGIAVVVEPSGPRAEWYLANCQLVLAAENALPRIAPIEGANHALVHSESPIGSRVSWFRCAERPPWPRVDAAEVRRLYAELERRRGFACGPPFVPFGSRPTEIAVLAPGADRAPDGSFAHVRVRSVGWLARAGRQVHHGRVVPYDHPDNVRATAIARGTWLPIDEQPMDQVRHTSCYFPCEREALAHVGRGGTVTYVCDDTKKELELVGWGDERMFRAFLGI